MKTSLQLAMLFILAVCMQTGLKAQGFKLPQASSAQTLVQEFGLGQITIKYSRPNTKGRKIFGDLEPFGCVWRTGANSATVITFSEEVTFEGKTVPAGQYALFTIPGKNEWTVILNKNTQQWGAYDYKEDEDFLRVDIKPKTLKDKVESFHIDLGEVYPTHALLTIAWDHTMIPIRLSTDIDAKVMASIDKAMKGDKKPYFQAAQYYFENGKDLNKALEWMNAAETADPKGPWIRLWKGRVQLKMGDKKGAAATAEAGIKLAKDANNAEYVRLNKALLAEAKK